jgi:hypothetical protein
MPADKPVVKLPSLYPINSTHHLLSWAELMDRYYYCDSLWVARRIDLMQ